ncbi:sodium/potassium/calcium exchanger 4 [Tribolium castaneum]|uniref:Sodium/potassium/calcium exchanger 5 n=1 Tax=Tribolium castaneum TaxID=7070 RepID=D6WM88_TRICA|nr:PREDICTED: sodium/potassium/calcium exchanger 4 [Tribolium castaneum]EFA03342.1 Sodium/potassium/calcium exchanger 5-like Protein [Tribolium castaneum]|eukprot:XP_968752.1 PREDICTED: sodium/potassium/calcium exchanger 4 [Tribolium castaneum]
MGMLLRTRKVALGLKVICIVSVTATYAVLGAVSRKHRTEEDSEFENVPTGRHLLGLIPPFNCTPAAINEFPADGFSRLQRQNGWIVLHVLLACYLFILLAVVCDDYFVPAIKKFCDSLNMREDVAGATFMAMASSSPELFINCVGTFVTQGDIGVGAIVGSAVFNVLAVPACCGLFANMVIYLDWWPISRDSMMYGISVILLICFLQDGKIYLYEAFALILVYAIYILIMFFNSPLMRLANSLVSKCRRKGHYVEIIAETTPLLTRGEEKSGVSEILETEFTLKDCEDLEESTKIWEWPSDQSRRGQFWWVLTWPISFLLYLTTPDCRKYPRLFVVTFIMCIFWIGVTSYIISWLITVIGDTLDIPDSVMGLTFLAAGMSVPEAVSSVIVTNQGYGSMGLSSSIASNTFDILLCLGLPWFIKTGYYPKSPKKRYIKINSAGLSYSAISLLSTLVLFYLSVAFNKFRLNWKVGLSCLLMYIAFLTLASLIELNTFFPVNLPTCDR